MTSNLIKINKLKKLSLFFKDMVNELRPEESGQKFATDAIQMVADLFCLIMEFLYIEQHKFVDDYK